MSIKTYLPGRLGNTKLPARDGLFPLFEAVVNSIHAIEDSGAHMGQGHIKVEIQRGVQNLDIDEEDKKRGPDPLPPIVNFVIHDNGIGFNEKNMLAFMTLDTDNKRERGGKGIGRLLWLKAFTRVQVRSTFVEEDGSLKHRIFTFDESSGISDDKVDNAEEKDPPGTTVSLMSFRDNYRKSVFKTPEPIAKAIIDHCLWYFIRPGGAPRIEIEDAGQVVNLNNVYEQQMHSNAVIEKITIKDREFELLHIKLRADSTNGHKIAYCADMRLVKETKLEGKVPGLHGALSDEQGSFYHSCYVSSPFLDEHTRTERTGIDLAEDLGELFEETEITWKGIEKAVADQVAIHLDDFLKANKERAIQRVDTFVSVKAPRYRPIVQHIPPEELYVDPEISDKELELTLHKHYADMEQKLLAQGHDLLRPPEGGDEVEYHKRVDEYLSRVEDIKKSDLVNYVSHRKVILDLLELALQLGPDGKYKREDVLHSFIMPMRTESNEVRFECCNLWLIDERLAFHDYLASDKTLAAMPITDSTETKEPDLLALRLFEHPFLVSEGGTIPSASLVVVEIKRPMRNDAGPGRGDDPIEQALDYLDRIRRNVVTTSKGRPIPNADRMPGFCYIVADLTETVRQRCRFFGLARTSDGLGYFGHNKELMSYIQVISFDGLVQAAKERNRAFFDQLGLPTT